MDRRLRRGVPSLVLALATMLGLLVGGPVRANADPTPGTLSVTPSAGDVTAVPTFLTSAGCPAPADSWVLSLTGPGLPSAGSVWSASDAGLSATAGFDVAAGMSFAAFATSLGTTFQRGAYQVSVACTVSASLVTVASFTTRLTFSSSTHWSSAAADNGFSTNVSISLARDPTSGNAAYSSQILRATVTPADAQGSITFYDNGSSTPIPGEVTSDGSGTYTLMTSVLGGGSGAAGDHTVWAYFTGTGSFGSGDAESAPVSFHLDEASCPGDMWTYPDGGSCSDTQSIQVAVDPGFLTITTPYTSTHPYVLPPMQLDADATRLSSSARFPALGDAPLTITSTLAGDPDWTATLDASDLVTSTPAPAGTVNVIDGQNVGFTGWTELSSSNPASHVTFTDTPALSGIQPGAGSGTSGAKGTHVFAATAGGGDGTVQAVGTLTVDAPTNTVEGTYDGTIVFTVS